MTMAMNIIKKIMMMMKMMMMRRIMMKIQIKIMMFIAYGRKNEKKCEKVRVSLRRN